MQEKRPQKKARSIDRAFLQDGKQGAKAFLRTRCKTTIDAHFCAKRFALNIV